MYSIFSFFQWQWWFYLMFSFLGFGVTFFIPGITILSFLTQKISKTQKFIIAPVLGLSLWGMQAYIFGHLHLRFFSYLYILLFLFLFLKQRKRIFPFRIKLSLSKIEKFLIFFGSLLQLVGIFGSGFPYKKGIRFFFNHAYDGIFHLSLARALIDQVPPLQPGAYDLFVTNYHYLSNLIIAEFSRIWHVPINHLYFQYIPLWFSVWFGLLIVFILRNWSGKSLTSALGLLFFYFVGELTWLIIIILKTQATNPFEVFVDHGVLQFFNPPQAFAKIVFLATLLLLRKFWEDKDCILACILAVMIASLVSLKVYFGIVAVLGLGAVYGVKFISFIFKTLKEKRNVFIDFWKFFQVDIVFLTLTAVLMFILYFPVNAHAGGLFFDFLTWPKLLLGAGKIDWNEWWLRLQVYQQAKSIKGLAFLYGLSLIIFFTSLFHVRLFGFLSIVKKYRGKILFEEWLYLFPSAIIFILIGMNFLQISGGYNVFNFFVVALVICNLLSALVFAHISYKNIFYFIFVTLLLAPGLVQTFFAIQTYMQKYYNKSDNIVISPLHMEALSYFSNLPYALLQTHPNHYIDHNPPYLYFFTGKYSYFGGRGILESHNQNIAERLEQLDLIFEDVNTATFSAQIAASNSITHVLLDKRDQKQNFFYNSRVPESTRSGTFAWSKVFENTNWQILEVMEID